VSIKSLSLFSEKRIRRNTNFKPFKTSKSKFILNEFDFSSKHKNELETDLKSLMKEYDPENLNNSEMQSFILPKRTISSLERTLEKSKSIFIKKEQSP
jgi:hypothetical protein